MKNQFVSYEIAKKLKELGFNEQCIGLQSKIGFRLVHEVTMDYNRSNSELQEPLIAAPLWQQAIDWLREKHGVVAFADPINVMSHKAKVIGLLGEWEAAPNDVYEYAREAAILKALELLNSK